MNPILILTGPTGVGKTETSLLLAKSLNGEIISCDSMQVYQTMNIGTAKIKEEEKMGVPHHLLDLITPDQPFDVYAFQTMAKEKIREILDRKHLPILVGGTGFYIRALLYDNEFEQNHNDLEYRNQLLARSKEQGPLVLHSMLKEVDSESAANIHPNNVKRVIRALEFYHETGIPISTHNQQMRKKESPYDFHYFVLTMERELLYKRINARVEEMLKDGLVEEAKKLYDKQYDRHLTSMQAIGYKELFAYFDGEISLDEAKEWIQKNSRHYAKRQLTWFRKEKIVEMIDKTGQSAEETAHLILSRLEPEFNFS